MLVLFTYINGKRKAAANCFFYAMLGAEVPR